MESNKDNLSDKLKTIKESMFAIKSGGTITLQELLMFQAMELILEYLEEQTK